MGRTKNGLTATRVKALKDPGRYGDGDGLFLVIDKRGGKFWVLRVVVKGKRNERGGALRIDIGLGGTSWVSLAEAREKARELRKLAREGNDPRAALRASKECPTFEEAARQVHAEQIEPHARNRKHRAQWINTLATYAFPLIGSMPVREIEQRDVLAVLVPIWTSKPETARRVRQRIRTVLDWARTAGHFEGINPVEGVEKGLPKQRDKVRHHPALPYAELPGLMQQLESVPGIGALTLRFAILTACRSGEVRGARWSELDLEAKVWTIPAERMKAGREHRVPLSDEAIAVLEKVRGLNAEFVFPGTKPAKAPPERRSRGLSDMAMTQLLRRLGRGDVTAHGFRSTFRDWAWERTTFPREVSELCLAHEVGNATERAYARSDLFEKRRNLMDQWGRFCCLARADVVELQHRRQANLRP